MKELKEIPFKSSKSFYISNSLQRNVAVPLLGFPAESSMAVDSEKNKPTTEL